MNGLKNENNNYKIALGIGGTTTAATSTRLH